MEQSYWLVADGGKTPRFICVEAFGLRWTDAEEKALRLSRREDAEAIAELCEDAWQVLARHAPAAAPASEREAVLEEAAQVCKKFRKERENMPSIPGNDGAIQALAAAEAAIRAMKGKGGGK